jgi:hypothetical protein
LGRASCFNNPTVRLKEFDPISANRFPLSELGYGKTGFPENVKVVDGEIKTEYYIPPNTLFVL